MVHSMAASRHSAVQPTYRRGLIIDPLNCLEWCTGRGGRVEVQHMLGGLIGGDVTIQRTTKEAAQGKGARGGFECISDAAQTRGEVARMEAPVDGVLTYIAGGRGI